MQYMAAALSLALFMQQDLPLHPCLLQEDDKFRLLLSRTLNVDGSDGASYFDKVGQAAAACLCQPYVLAKILQLAPAECVTSAALSPLAGTPQLRYLSGWQPVTLIQVTVMLLDQAITAPLYTNSPWC